MEIKTLEEFFIKQYNELEDELAEAKKEIEELKRPKTTAEAIDIDIKQNLIQLSINPTYYYRITIAPSYNINDILKDNKVTPEDLLSIENDVDLINFCGISGGMWMQSIGMVEERKADYYICDFYGNDYVLEFNKNAHNTDFNNIDKTTYFLDPSEAADMLIVKLKKVIEEYKKYGYDKKFYEEGK